MTSWRRLGFGRFLLIMVIKWCTRSLLIAKGYARNRTLWKEWRFIYNAVKNVDCGFVRINGPENDGKELLPKSIAATLKVGDR